MRRAVPRLRRGALLIRGPYTRHTLMGPDLRSSVTGRCSASPWEGCTASGTRRLPWLRRGTGLRMGSWRASGGAPVV